MSESHIPERTARIIEEIKEHQKKLGEKTLEEMLFIFEGQGYISSPQDVCFKEIIGNYHGNKRQEFIDRYRNVGLGDCYGL